MMTKSAILIDPRQTRSWDALERAFMFLSHSHVLADVTVTQLARCAQISRPTFYQHARDVRDLAAKVALARLSAATPVLPGIGSAQEGSGDAISDTLARTIAAPLTHLAENRRFYKSVLEFAGSPDLYARIVDLLLDRMDSGLFSDAARTSGVSPIEIAKVVHGGLMWRIVGWLIDGIDETPPQDLASEIGKIFSALVERPAIGKCSGNP